MTPRRMMHRAPEAVVAAVVCALFALTVGAGIALGDTSQAPTQADSTLRRQDNSDRQDIRVTSFRSVVALGTTGAGQLLPLTGVTVAGRCRSTTPPPIPPPGGFTSNELAEAVVEAGSGSTMDAVSMFSGTFGGQSLVTQPFADTNIDQRRFGTTNVIVSSGGATATITIGASIELDTGACTFIGQAVEAPGP
jgi:hypothetical protein